MDNGNSALKLHQGAEWQLGTAAADRPHHKQIRIWMALMVPKGELRIPVSKKVVDWHSNGSIGDLPAVESIGQINVYETQKHE